MKANSQVVHVVKKNDKYLSHFDLGEMNEYISDITTAIFFDKDDLQADIDEGNIINSEDIKIVPVIITEIE